MSDFLPTHQATLREALTLSTDILRNIELNELPLSNIALKSSRLARLLNDFDAQKIMAFESSGYLLMADDEQAIQALAISAGRTYQKKDITTKALKEQIYLESIESLEQTKALTQISLEMCSSPRERDERLAAVKDLSDRLSARRAYIYQYVLQKHYLLKFSSVIEDAFTHIRTRVDEMVGLLMPEVVKKFSAIYDNLGAADPAQALDSLHHCQYLLQTLAQVIAAYPSDEILEIDGVAETPAQTTDVLMRFVHEKATSEEYLARIQACLTFLNDGPVAFQAVHTPQLTREVAERYVVYTYMVLDDIFSLMPTTKY